MNRRLFLQAGLAAAASLAWSDEATYRGFHAGLRRTSNLQLLSGVTGDQSGVARVEGRIPRELNGRFFRNGPGRFELGGERYHHWFDGDGMAQCWQIANGQVSHRGRFVRTAKFEEESAAGRFLYPSFATPLKNGRPIANNDTLNTANTNLLPHHGKLYALWEGGSATELDPDTLETRGIVTWRDDVKAMPFSAHPKVEPDGTWWNVGAIPGRNKVALYRIAANGELLKAAVIDVPNVTMLHDFVVTERHLVLLLPSYRWQPQGVGSFLDSLHFDRQQAMLAVVIDKAEFTVKQTLELPAGLVFHFGNAFDDGDTIRLDATLFSDDGLMQAMRANMRGERIDPHSHHGDGHATLFTLDLGKRSARSERLLADTEFPRVDPRLVGQRHRYSYMLAARPQDTIGLSSVVRVNIEDGKTERYAFGRDWAVEEHIPVPKKGGSVDQVWLLGVARHLPSKRTVLTVFDGERVAAGPIAKAWLPYAAPLCFHGNFLAA